MPSTVTAVPRMNALVTQGQRKVFKNPRGLEYYYVLSYKLDAGNYYIRLFKSSDGTSWGSAGNIVNLGGSDTLESMSLTIVEDAGNSRLLIYTVYALTNGSLVVRCHPIADGSSDLGAELWNNTLQAIECSRPVIEIGRRGGREYLWVVYQWHYRSKGVDYYDIKAQCTTSTMPTSAPTWSAQETVFTATSGYAIPSTTIAPLSATHDMLIVWAVSVPAGKTVFGKEYSWNGAAFSSGTSDSFINTWSTPVSAVVDSANVGHIMFRRYIAPTIYLKAVKWTVGSGFSSETIIYTADLPDYSLSIDLTSSPDKLYAFYYRAAGKLHYKTSPVDTVSWSAETEIADDTEQILQFSSYYKDWGGDGEVAVMYTQRFALNVRFEKVGGAPPPPGWTGKISGVTNPSKIMGINTTNISKVKGVS